MILAVGPANDAIFDEQAFQDNCKYIANAGVRDLPNVPCSRNMFLEGSLIFGGFGVPLFKGEQGR